MRRNKASLFFTGAGHIKIFNREQHVSCAIHIWALNQTDYEIISPLLFALPFFKSVCTELQHFTYSWFAFKNANAVKRYEELRFENKGTKGAKNMQQNTRIAYWMKGERYAAYATYYDKFHDINYIDGNLFRRFRQNTKNVKEKDIEDPSGNDDESLMVDTRFKVHNFLLSQLSLHRGIWRRGRLDGMFDIPDWTPQQSNILSVAYSKFVIVAPKNYALRYKLKQYYPTAGNNREWW